MLRFAFVKICTLIKDSNRKWYDSFFFTAFPYQVVSNFLYLQLEIIHQLCANRRDTLQSQWMVRLPDKEGDSWELIFFNELTPRWRYMAIWTTRGRVFLEDLTGIGPSFLLFTFKMVGFYYFVYFFFHGDYSLFWKNLVLVGYGRNLGIWLGAKLDLGVRTFIISNNVLNTINIIIKYSNGVETTMRHTLYLKLFRLFGI